jgi:uncharacterized protein
MPHARQRFLASAISRALAYSPIVGVLGQRQVGKTTLLESASAEYATFDRAIILAQANADAERFLQGHAAPFGIDEAQLCPPLFPALKEHVRVDKRKGRFLLSGSVRFTSKADIRESLTGRIVSLELLPFTQAEADGRALPDLCARLLKVRAEKDLTFLAGTGAKPAVFSRYLAQGGLPGICFFRDVQVRNEKFAAHLDTLLNRDIRQIYPTTLLYGSLRALLEYLARNQGRPFELADAARASQISSVTLKRVMFALEALFLIRVVPALEQGKPTVFLEDQGMASWLAGAAAGSADDIVRGLYANLRQEVHYRPDPGNRISHWRTRHEAEVPLVFDLPQGRLGFIATTLEEPAAKSLGSANAFLRRFPAARVVLAYAGRKIVFKAPSMVWIPYWLLI